MFFCVCASNSQDSPKASPRVIFKRKNLIEQLKLCSNECCLRRPSMLSSMCQHVARLQFDSCAGKDSLSGTVMMAWIWHVWINATVFVPMAQAPPKAGAKDLSYNSLNLIHDFTSLFSPKVIVAGLPRESFPHAFVDSDSVVAHQDSSKASPRAILKWKNLIEPLKLLS